MMTPLLCSSSRLILSAVGRIKWITLPASSWRAKSAWKTKIRLKCIRSERWPVNPVCCLRISELPSPTMDGTEPSLPEDEKIIQGTLNRIEKCSEIVKTALIFSSYICTIENFDRKPISFSQNSYLNSEYGQSDSIDEWSSQVFPVVAQHYVPFEHRLTRFQSEQVK